MDIREAERKTKKEKKRETIQGKKYLSFYKGESVNVNNKSRAKC